MTATTNFLHVTENEVGERLDKLLSTHFPDHSRTYFQQLIEEGLVEINEKPARKRTPLTLGDAVSITFKEPPQIDVKPEAIALDILYEDEALIAVNKPVGMVVHPAPGAYSGTFANALVHHCKGIETEGFEKTRPGIVHRLDKDTTGILVAAKSLAAHQKLTKQFTERQVDKRYLAVCLGVPKEGRFIAPIRRHPVRRKEMCVDETGKEAISEMKILGKNKELSLVEIKLITGRTHQIRVHLKEMNCPILGDPVYGSKRQNQARGIHTQLLHAHSMKLVHPFLGTPLELVAPPPSAMKNFIDLIVSSRLQWC